ncbi:MAG: RNA-binding protein [Acidobacteria bacterium]|nr:RNA-binding protein [Acidobacteriota bacterium]
MGRKLYVGNLPYSIGEAELQDLFGKAGAVESVRVMRDMATGRARGFAFVEMATDEEAQKAISEFNEYARRRPPTRRAAQARKCPGRSGHPPPGAPAAA